MNLIEAAGRQFERALRSCSAEERSHREQAWDLFKQRGLPDRRTDGWRYSNLSSISRSEWNLSEEMTKLPAEAAAWRIRLSDTCDVAVLINGRLNLAESFLSPELRKWISADLPWGKSSLAGDGLQEMVSAVALSGMHLRVPDNVQDIRPLAIMHVQIGEGSWTSAQHQIEVGANSSLDVADVYIGGNERYLRTESARISVAEGARLNWSLLQWEGQEARHFVDLEFALNSRAQLVAHSLQAGAAWSRTNIRVDIAGVEAEAEVRGLTFGRSRQHVDHRVVMNHQVGNSRSSQLFKGVLRDQARGIFNGKIQIAREAQKVASSQLNHNLLLSPGAEADTQPELEIFADDVKANHGASIGRLDEDRLFYLESRGICPEEARRLLAHAFVEDVLMKMPGKALRELAEDLVKERLGDFMEGMQS